MAAAGLKSLVLEAILGHLPCSLVRATLKKKISKNSRRRAQGRVIQTSWGCGCKLP